ncbi:MAG: sulfatase [Candidatus Nitrospinota bacterium M3_3B_026]
MRKIVRRAAWALLAAAALYIFWMGVFVLPNPSRVSDPLLVLEGTERFGGQRLQVTQDLLFELESAEVSAPNLEQGKALLSGTPFFADHPFTRLEKNQNMAVSMTQGKHAMFLEQRDAVYMPTPSSVRYRLEVPEGARLRFGTSIMSRLDGRAQASVTFKVRVETERNKKEVFSKTLRPEPEFPWGEDDFWYHTFLKFIRIDHGFWNGKWYDNEIDLGPWAGEKIVLVFTAEAENGPLSHGFLGTPRIVAPDNTKKPNVIVVIMDTLRADHVGVNDPDARGLTPSIDKVAEEGISFTNVRSQGNWSRGSFASIFTGLPVPRLGFSERWSFTDEEKRIFYERRPPSLAGQFRRAGYAAVSIGNNPFVYDGSPVGLHLGFGQAIDVQREPYDTEFSTTEAIRWLKERGDERFFMMFTLNSAHSPFRPPFKYLWRGFKASWENIKNPQKLLYRGAVAYGDDYFGEFLAALDRLGLSENTILVVTADHGVVLDHEGAIRSKPGGRYDWIKATHTHTLYDEELRVPLVARYPGRAAGGAKSPAPLALLDLAPTLAEAAGVAGDPRWPGTSFAEELSKPDGRLEGAPKGGRYITAEGESVWSMTTPDGYKYIRRGVRMARALDKPGGAPRSIMEEVFDLEKDPGEAKDLSRSAPGLVERLRDEFAREYPPHVRVYKSLIRGVDGLDSVRLDLSTEGRFVFLDVSPAGGAEGLSVNVENKGDGERTVTLDGLKTFVRVFFEIQPNSAPVSIEVRDGRGAPLGPGMLRITPLGIKNGAPSITLRAWRDSFYLSDPQRLMDEMAKEDGVYIGAIPFSVWRQDAAEGARLDPELEKMMRKWGYL